MCLMWPASPRRAAKLSAKSPEVVKETNAAFWRCPLPFLPKRHDTSTNQGRIELGGARDYCRRTPRNR